MGWISREDGIGVGFRIGWGLWTRVWIQKMVAHFGIEGEHGCGLGGRKSI
jgi:hypothetical protein